MKDRVDLSVAIPFAIFTLIWGSTWIVIRGQLGTVAPQWSVAYRFVIATIAMALVARWKGESLRLGPKAVLPALVLGFCQFCVNFNAVYLAERHITSGVVATVFALLLIPASLMAWAFLGQRPTQRFAWSSLVAVAGVMLLFAHELRGHAASSAQVTSGIALTFVGMIGASFANVLQARPEVRRFPAPDGRVLHAEVRIGDSIVMIADGNANWPAAGAHVPVTDPKAVNQAWRRYPRLRFEASTRRALEDAELVLLLTEWDEYRQLCPATAGALVRRRVVLDARNVLDAAAWQEEGWLVRGLGSRAGALAAVAAR